MTHVDIANVSNALQNIIGNFFDRRQLCILTGKHCWSIFVDVLILESDGNDIDASVLAIRAALFATRLPGVSLEEGTESEALVLSEDPKDARILSCQGLPVAVTLCQISSSSPSYFVDPSRAEQDCASSTLILAVEPVSGHLNFIQKFSDGLIDSSILFEIFAVAQSTASFLFERVQK